MSRLSARHQPKRATCAIAAAVISVLVPGAAPAQEPYVFPTKGQSTEQVEQDKYACYQWAKGQSGVDPMQAAAPSQKKRGGAVRGAAGGAAFGAAIGAIAGDAGKGAAIGAASGGIIGGARNRQGQKQQEAQAEQSSSEYQRAWGACMEGKGYTVK